MVLNVNVKLRMLILSLHYFLRWTRCFDWEQLQHSSFQYYLEYGCLQKIQGNKILPTEVYFQIEFNKFIIK